MTRWPLYPLMVLCAVSLAACTTKQKESDDSEETTLETYSVKVAQEGGGDSEYSTMEVSGLNEGDEREADEFVSVDFGWPEEYVDANPQKNVMWVQCMEGYRISSCVSKTSMLTPTSNNTCGLIIEDQPKNIVSFDCEKR